MKQLTEDYVSFEIAKLLKEKGFDVPTENFYDNTGENLKDMKTIYGGIPDFGEVNWNADPFVCEGFPKLITFSKPSQSLALKWLREVHNIYIDILTYTTGKSIQFRWVGYDNGRLFSQEEGKTIYFNSYNEAVEAALKYTLENLI